MPITIADIQREVAIEWGITQAELLGRCRKPKFIHPRVIAYQLARELTTASYPAIGKAFRRDHSTIVSGIARSHNLIDLFPEYLDKREAVKRRLASPAPQPQ